ncbi:hypothetical protein [Vibrio owensii]|uniref:hypothetical protein n=1 Tax=Vibrio harveyi group TaxID=717610 RepID=UPI003CC6967A
MKFKTIFAGMCVVSAVAYGGYQYSGLHAQKTKIDNFLAEFSARGVNITYDPINPLKLVNAPINLKNVSIKTDDLQISSEYLIFDDSIYDSGALNLVNTRFDSNSFSGTVDTVNLASFSWNDISKSVNMTFSGMSIDSSALDIPRGNGELIIEQNGTELSTLFSTLSDNGDMMNANIRFKVKPDLAGYMQVGKSINEGAITKASIKLRNVGMYQSLQKKSPEIDSAFNQLALKMVSHHQPKAKRIGGEISEFLTNKNRLSVEVEPSAPIKLSQFEQLDKADPYKLIGFLKLKLEAPEK